jgi:hypothetical protein
MRIGSVSSVLVCSGLRVGVSALFTLAFVASFALAFSVVCAAALKNMYSSSLNEPRLPTWNTVNGPAGSATSDLRLFSLYMFAANLTIPSHLGKFHFLFLLVAVLILKPSFLSNRV